MITDLESEIKFLRDQVGSKDTYFHEEIKFLLQQHETALSKQENSNVCFCKPIRHIRATYLQHIRSNIVNYDDSITMTD